MAKRVASKGKKSRGAAHREPLSHERILDAAMALADEHGIEALSMRKLGQALCVEAMSLYNHVPNKDAILDGLVDRVMSEIALPELSHPWREALRRRSISAREVLRKHTWAPPLLDSRRNPGPATLRHHESVLRTLREAGFSVKLAAHAFSLLDAYTYGFVLQERALPFDSPEELEEVAHEILAGMPEGEFPCLEEIAREQVLTGVYDPAAEFLFGLDFVLDGLETLLTQ